MNTAVPEGSSNAAPPDTPSDAGSDQALLRACRSVMAPLARLAISHGLRHGQLDELLRGAFVDAARDALEGVPANRSVSRVSAATGLNRREVTRLMKSEAVEPARRSLATQLFTRWLSDPTLRRKGKPVRTLPRQGAEQSFERLAQAVTRDVHPRTLLEEMARLGLARFDEGSDTVHLLRESFVPSSDERRMLELLGGNVGDHLSAAVSNVLGQEPRHLEQALFADELSTHSIDKLQPLVRAQWQALLRELAPKVQAMIDEDEAQAKLRNQRLRVGMYAYAAPMPVVGGQASAPAGADEGNPARERRRIK